MKFRYILLVIISLAIVSCSGYDKLIKGRDYAKMYEEALRYYSLKKDSRAVTLFEVIEDIYSGTNKIDTIKFYKAKAYYRMGDYYAAGELLDNFRKTYSRGPFAEEAEYLYAMSYYEAAPNSELDQTNTQMAMSAFHEYLERYPDSPRKETIEEVLKELQMRLYDKSLDIAQTYYYVGYYNSAIHTLRNELKKMPDTPHREKILYMIVKASYQYAKASVEVKQKERFLNTIDAYHRFVSEYPESKYSEEVLHMFNNATSFTKGVEGIAELRDKLDINAKAAARQDKRLLKAVDKVDKGKLSADRVKTKVTQSLAEARVTAAAKEAKDNLRGVDSTSKKAKRLAIKEAAERQRYEESIKILEQQRAEQQTKQDVLRRKKFEAEEQRIFKQKQREDKRNKNKNDK